MFITVDDIGQPPFDFDCKTIANNVNNLSVEKNRKHTEGKHTVKLCKQESRNIGI